MSGVFTSGKLKLMANHIDKVGKNFEKYVSIQAREKNEIDIKVASWWINDSGFYCLCWLWNRG